MSVNLNIENYEDRYSHLEGLMREAHYSKFEKKVKYIKESEKAQKIIAKNAIFPFSSALLGVGPGVAIGSLGGPIGMCIGSFIGMIVGGIIGGTAKAIHHHVSNESNELKMDYEEWKMNYDTLLMQAELLIALEEEDQNFIIIDELTYRISHEGIITNEERIYDKEAILERISNVGTDPISYNELSENELIPLNISHLSQIQFAKALLINLENAIDQLPYQDNIEPEVKEKLENSYLALEISLKHKFQANTENLIKMRRNREISPEQFLEYREQFEGLFFREQI